MRAAPCPSRVATALAPSSVRSSGSCIFASAVTTPEMGSLSDAVDRQRDPCCLAAVDDDPLILDEPDRDERDPGALAELVDGHPGGNQRDVDAGCDLGEVERRGEAGDRPGRGIGDGCGCHDLGVGERVRGGVCELRRNPPEQGGPAGHHEDALDPGPLPPTGRKSRIDRSEPGAAETPAVRTRSRAGVVVDPQPASGHRVASPIVATGRTAASSQIAAVPPARYRSTTAPVQRSGSTPQGPLAGASTVAPCRASIQAATPSKSPAKWTSAPRAESAWATGRQRLTCPAPTASPPSHRMTIDSATQAAFPERRRASHGREDLIESCVISPRPQAVDDRPDEVEVGLGVDRPAEMTEVRCVGDGDPRPSPLVTAYGERHMLAELRRVRLRVEFQQRLGPTASTSNPSGNVRGSTLLE